MPFFAGAATGFIAGAAAGSMMGGPVGAVFGGLGSMYATSYFIDSFFERMTESIFDVPKTVAEERAYAFFHLRRTATDDEISNAYRHRAAMYHPDNKATFDPEMFLETQLQLEIIRMGRRKTEKMEL